MWKSNLKEILYIVVLLFLFILLTPSYAKDIYRWVDKDGTLHFTDNPAGVPEEKMGEAEIIGGEEESPGEKAEVDLTKITHPLSGGESLEVDLEEEERKEEALREVWRGRALKIEAREKAILEDIEITKQRIRGKKREVDSLLINGYFADYSILELRYLNALLQDHLRLIEQARADLQEEADRKGIPPGYLRP